MTEHATPASPAPATIRCVEPATGRPLGEVPLDDAAAVRAAIASARTAQPLLAESSFRRRRSLLRHLLAHILEHADELCELVVRDSGKTRENAMLGEVWPIAEKIRWTLRHGEKHLRPESVSSGLFAHKRARIEYPARGVVGIVCPWNYPLQNILGPAIPALFAGNAVVLKISEQVAFSAARFQQIFDEALDAVRLPRDLVRFVHGFAETGAALVSGGVDLVVFTGSLPNGRKVIAESAQTVTPVIAELGGKDPLIVCDDAHLEQAAHGAMTGCFVAAGQNCLAAERILVFDAIHDRFVARVSELAGRLRQAAPDMNGGVDVGALVTPQQVDIVERLVEDALARGARALVGGKRVSSAGNFFEPTVLVDVTPSMAIMKEETFGPVMAICRVADEEEAIEIANGTDYGLSATVYSRDLARARRIARRIAAGSSSVNDFGLTYMAQDLPFGGVRGSGYGRLNGREGLRACTTRKAVLEDRFALHVPAKLYPVAASSYGLTRGVLRALYTPTWRGKARGVLDLAKVLRDAR